MRVPTGNVPDRICSWIEGGNVHQMEQQAGSLQMAQKLVSKPRTFGRAFDQARNVGDHEAAIFIDAHDS